MKNNRHFLFIFTIALVTSFSCAAQLPADIEKLFPGKLAAYSNINNKVNISLKNGVPYAESYEVKDMVILNDKANSVYNQESIYSNSFKELKKIEAYTLVPEGDDMKKIKVIDFRSQSAPSESVFSDDSRETQFNFPKLLRGSVAHVESDFYSKDVRFLMPFYFSSYLPVCNAVYSISFPEEVEVKYIIKNDDKKNIVITESIKGKKKTLEFSAKSVPNYEYYEDGTGINYYAPHVIVYIANYKSADNNVAVFNTVNDLYKWNVGFLKDINTTPDAHLKEIVDSICVGKRTQKEKAVAIYHWVQQNIKYVAFEQGLEGFIPRQAAEVCSKRYGDCKDMASLLTAMLTLSGIDAHFTWIGTRRIPYTYTEVPLPITDNHMICAARIENDWVFLDATDPNCIFGFPSSAIQNKQALISMDPEKFELITVPVIPATSSSVTDSTFLSIKENVLNGFTKIAYTGYAGADVYNALLYKKREDEKIYVRQKITRGSNKFIIKDYKVDLPDTNNKYAVLSGSFDLPDYIKSVGNEIYINLNPAKLVNLLPIDTNARKVSIENDYRYIASQTHVLDIPEGYTAEYIPKNISFSNDLVSVTVKYEQQQGKIISTQSYEQKKLYILPTDFAEWNRMLNAITPAYKEQVVLKKK